MLYPHLFGPVLSRRLGRSIGVDMIPFKTCNCNCVYCECGEGRPINPKRREYVSGRELIGEIKQFLDSRPEADYITFGGSGEPTLNTSLGTIVRFVKQNYPLYKTALLTNGTLLHLPEVREEILPCDLVLPSFDAASEEVFRKINRPHPSCDLRLMKEGLFTFSQQYRGLLWVEVFIVPGVNDSPEELSLIKETLLKLRLDRVQLNSLDRPGACNWVTAPTPQRMAEIADYLKPLPVEIISRKAVASISAFPHPENLDGTILHQLQRRPATVDEIAVMCSATIKEIAPLLETLINKGKITKLSVENRVYYSVVK